jgi:hypothetical protein
MITNNYYNDKKVSLVIASGEIHSKPVLSRASVVSGVQNKSQKVEYKTLMIHENSTISVTKIIAAIINNIRVLVEIIFGLAILLLNKTK